MIYFDNAATTRMDEEVLDAMLPYLKDEYGNPSSKYYCKSINSSKAVALAREQVANLISASPEEIVFTAGATESANFIIKGYLDYSKYYESGKSQVITSNAEHQATINICKYLNGEIYSNKDATVSLFSGNKKVDRGFSSLFIPVDNYGIVSIDSLKKNLSNDTAIASFIYVNNEVGSINNVETIADICHKNGTKVHIDATQAIGKLPIDVKTLNCDYMSGSAHKFYGPKGVGFAYLKADKYGVSPISSVLHGGEQENGLRAGTLAVHNIVGLGKAAEIARRDISRNAKKIDSLDKYFVDSLSSFEDVKLILPSENRLKGMLSILIDRRDFNNERFIKKVSDEVAISTGSACSLGKPSHVLEAMGFSDKINKVIRVSISKYNEKSDIDRLINLLRK